MSSRAVLFLDTAMPFETESDVIWCHRKQKLLRFKAIDCLLKSFLPFDTRIRSEQKKSLGTYVKGERNCNFSDGMVYGVNDQCHSDIRTYVLVRGHISI